MSRIDLHVHSTASDGTDPPGEIPRLAAEAGLRAVALTDHDTVAGIPAFLEAARAYPELEAIPGVELSTLYSARELHLVGLFIDPESEVLLRFLETMRQERRERGERIRQKLTSLGYPLTRDDPAFGLLPEGASLGRPHFARALVTKYGFSDMQAVFDKLLKHGAAAYVPRKLPDPGEAIATIHAAGGVAVWAHPVYRERNERAFAKRIMKRFAPLGLDGVEAYYSLFGPGETALIRELAGVYGLALSGGSDYHGDATKINIGSGAGKLAVPGELLDELKKRKL